MPLNRVTYLKRTKWVISLQHTVTHPHCMDVLTEAQKGGRTCQQLYLPSSATAQRFPHHPGGAYAAVKSRSYSTKGRVYLSQVDDGITVREREKKSRHCVCVVTES